jgi:hypothetical protein
MIWNFKILANLLWGCWAGEQDKNGDMSISHAEFIKGIRENPWIAKLLGPIPSLKQLIFRSL